MWEQAKKEDTAFIKLAAHVLTNSPPFTLNGIAYAMLQNGSLIII